MSGPIGLALDAVQLPSKLLQDYLDSTPEQRCELIAVVSGLLRAKDGLSEKQIHQIFAGNLSMGDMNINYGRPASWGRARPATLRKTTGTCTRTPSTSARRSGVGDAEGGDAAGGDDDRTGSCNRGGRFGRGGSKAERRGFSVHHLRQAGKWALDVATNIGTTVAVDAIKKATGL